MFKKIKSFFGLDSKTGEQENEAMSQLSTIEQLKKLGYMYNDKGILVKVDAPEEGFTFQGQAHYEKLGDVVADEIQRRIREEYHLEEHWLPTDDESERPSGCKCNVFTTPDILTSEAPLAVFICGSGAVVAGQWARSLCINNSLDEGSSLPEIEFALKNNWSVLVTNNNMEMGTKRNDNSNERALCAWKRFVRPSRARTIAVLAHSYGGINTCHIIDNELDSGSTEVLDRIACIAFTDSVHYPPKGASEEWFSKLGPQRVRNWVQSDDPLDTEEESYDCIKCVSAGHRKHEFTTCSARKSVHKFMIENVEEYLGKEHGEVEGEEEKTIEKKEGEKKEEEVKGTTDGGKQDGAVDNVKNDNGMGVDEEKEEKAIEKSEEENEGKKEEESNKEDKKKEEEKAIEDKKEGKKEKEEIKDKEEEKKEEEVKGTEENMNEGKNEDKKEDEENNKDKKKEEEEEEEKAEEKEKKKMTEEKAIEKSEEENEGKKKEEKEDEKEKKTTDEENQDGVVDNVNNDNGMEVEEEEEKEGGKDKKKGGNENNATKEKDEDGDVEMEVSNP